MQPTWLMHGCRPLRRPAIYNKYSYPQQLVMPCFTLYPRRQKNQKRVDLPSHLSAAGAHHTPVIIQYLIYQNIHFNRDHICHCSCTLQSPGYLTAPSPLHCTDSLISDGCTPRHVAHPLSACYKLPDSSLLSTPAVAPV